MRYLQSQSYPFIGLVIFWLFVALSLTQCAEARAATEDDHVREWCPIGAEVEFRLEDGTRVDCLTDEYAIEVDWAHKWAEAIGQSLYYADQTGRKPGILLIVGCHDWRYVTRLLAAIQAQPRPIRVWFKQDFNGADANCKIIGKSFRINLLSSVRWTILYSWAQNCPSETRINGVLT